MNIPTFLISISGLAAIIAGLATIYYRRDASQESIKLLQINIGAYKDSEKLKDQRIAYLEGQLVIKDETIKRLLNDGK